jgi:stress response protein YsnF
MTKAEDKADDNRLRWETVAIVPLVAETAAVSKRFRTTGRVRVKVRTETERRMLIEELAGQEIEIQRVPRNELIEAIPEVRTENGTTIIPLVQEQLVVEKRLVLVEEVRLHRVHTKQTVTVPVDLRAERADIEHIEVQPQERPSRS